MAAGPWDAAGPHPAQIWPGAGLDPFHRELPLGMALQATALTDSHYIMDHGSGNQSPVQTLHLQQRTYANV